MNALTRSGQPQLRASDADLRGDDRGNPGRRKTLMLVSEPLVLVSDPLMNMIANVNGNSPIAKELRTGVYETGHFGSSHWPSEEWEQWADVDGLGAYGVCDTVEQLLARCPSLESDPKREFFVRVTPVLKANQSPDGGWRWHKWGEYIGTHTPQHEYLYDEEGIDGVLCFHIYERKPEFVEAVIGHVHSIR